MLLLAPLPPASGHSLATGSLSSPHTGQAGRTRDSTAENLSQRGLGAGEQQLRVPQDF